MDKRTLALYLEYAAIVDWACSPFNKEIANVAHSNKPAISLASMAY